MKKQFKDLTAKQKQQVIEHAIRLEVRKQLKEYDDDGSELDALNEKLWNALETYVKKWAHTSVVALEKYAKKANSIEPDSIDEEHLISEFFEEFEAYSMWNEWTNEFKGY